MTNYTFTFTTGNNTTVITKAFATYMQAMNFGAEYAAKNNVTYYTMK